MSKLRDKVAGVLTETAMSSSKSEVVADAIMELILAANLDQQATIAKLTNVVSHATCGTMQYEGQTLNEISVKITKVRNDIYQDGKAHGAKDAQDTIAKLTKDKADLMRSLGDMLTRVDDAYAPEEGHLGMHVRGMSPDWFVEAAVLCTYGTLAQTIETKEPK